MNIRKISGIILCSMVVLLLQCTSGKSLPEDIVGKWTTDDQAYKGEFIEISINAISYGIEGGDIFIYTVRKVKKEKGHLYNSTTYKAYCTDESGVENLFTFIFTPDEGGSIRQKSTQDIVWKRVKS